MYSSMEFKRETAIERQNMITNEQGVPIDTKVVYFKLADGNSCAVELKSNGLEIRTLTDHMVIIPSSSQTATVTTMGGV